MSGAAPLVRLAGLAPVVVASALASAVNSAAGGGTRLTFPALVAVGLPPLVANATSTVALLPGQLSSMARYRRELAGAGAWARWFAAPSLAGGVVGAWLLLATPASRVDRIVPWLVLAATLPFVSQRALMRRPGGPGPPRGAWASGGPATSWC